MKIAQLAPLIEAVPPKLYGGTERVVAYLTDALVELGHEVTLFASGDSLTKAKLAPMWPRALRFDPDREGSVRSAVHAARDRGAARARVRRDSRPYRLLRISAAAAPRRSEPHDAPRSARFAGVAVALQVLPRRSRRLHLQFAARTLAAGELRGDRAARLAAGSAREGSGAGRLSRISRPHLPGKGAGCGDSHRRAGGHAAQDRGQGRPRGRGIFQDHHRAALSASATSSSSARSARIRKRNFSATPRRCSSRSPGASRSAW